MCSRAESHGHSRKCRCGAVNRWSGGPSKFTQSQTVQRSEKLHKAESSTSEAIRKRLNGRAAGERLTLHDVRLQSYIWTNHKTSEIMSFWQTRPKWSCLPHLVKTTEYKHLIPTIMRDGRGVIIWACYESECFCQQWTPLYTKGFKCDVMSQLHLKMQQ